METDDVRRWVESYERVWRSGAAELAGLFTEDATYLWVLRLDEDGRCAHFEEWPFSPNQPDGH